MTCDCGCEFDPILSGEVRWCPLHASAQQLLEACQLAEDHLEQELVGEKGRALHPIGQCPTLDVVKAAIAAATGEKLL